MSRKPGRERQTDIADAILAVVGREGIGALTMERLGRELGVTSGALFRHFPTRAAMLDQAAERAVALLESTLPAPDQPPLERLQQFLQARSRLAAKHTGIPQLVFSEQFSKALPPKGARALRGAVARTRGFLIAALGEAGARGEIRCDIPAEQLAPLVLGSLFARALLARTLPPDERSPDGSMGWSTLLALLQPPVGEQNRPSKQGRKRNHAE